MLDKEKVLTILKDVNFPGFTRDIVSFGIIKNVDFIEKKTADPDCVIISCKTTCF